MRDEFAKIDWLKTRFELGEDRQDIVLGIGDDAAVFDFGARPSIVTVDTQVERVHFRLDLLSCRDLGHRAMTAAASDVWAMAGTPAAALVALTLPPGFADESFRDLIEGLAEAARKTGARIIGGNLSEAECLSVTTTVFGPPAREPVRRCGARAGDSVYVTGTLGAAGLGLAILEAGRTELERAATFIGRWRRPPINAYAVEPLSEIATAAVDVSDGCLQDLEHLCNASKVGARLNAADLPSSTGHELIAMELGLDPVGLSLTAGEDYEILFTAPASEAAAALGTRIGEITDIDGVQVIGEAGIPLQIERAGFRHFS